MAELRAGYLPVTLYLERPYLPDISTSAGEVGRGYIITFIGADGRVIKPADDIEVRCWGLQDETGKTYYQIATVAQPEGDTFIATIPPEVIRSDGYATVQIVLKQANTTKLSTGAKTVFVGRSIDAGTAQSTSVYVDYEVVTDLAREARGLIESAKESAETALAASTRAAADLKTLEDGEAARVAAEQTRESNEKVRKAHESVRESNENARKQAEQNRASEETIRKNAEDTRKSNETSRASNESNRISNEAQRERNETERVTAETERDGAEAKRKEDEQTRVENEKARIDAEAKREENEQTRKTQEGERVEAEAARAAQFASWDKTMSGVLPDATESAKGVVTVSPEAEEAAPYTVPTLRKVEALVSSVDVTDQLPHNMSELTNDAGYLTTDDVVGVTTDEIWQMIEA